MENSWLFGGGSSGEMKTGRGRAQKHVNLITKSVAMLCGLLNMLRGVKLWFSLASLIVIWNTFWVQETCGIICLADNQHKLTRKCFQWNFNLNADFLQNNSDPLEAIARQQVKFYEIIRNWLNFIYLMAKLIGRSKLRVMREFSARSDATFFMFFIC